MLIQLALPNMDVFPDEDFTNMEGLPSEDAKPLSKFRWWRYCKIAAMPAQVTKKMTGKNTARCKSRIIQQSYVHTMGRRVATGLTIFGSYSGIIIDLALKFRENCFAIRLSIVLHIIFIKNGSDSNFVILLGHVDPVRQTCSEFLPQR